MTEPAKEWMVGLPGHMGVLTFEEVAELIRQGRVRESDMVKRVGEPWRAAGEYPEFTGLIQEAASRPPAPEPPPSEPAPGSRPGEITPPPLTHSTPGETAAAPAVPNETAASEAPPDPSMGMAPRYFSPTDLMRATSYAFAPWKLAVAAGMFVPAVIGFHLLDHVAEHHLLAGGYRGSGRILQFLAWTFLVYGVAISTGALTFMTRRQIEGIPFTFGEMGRHLRRYAGASLLFPLGGLGPIAIFVGILALLGIVRESGETMSTLLRVLHIIPLIVGALMVTGGLALQLATMYLPSSFASEGTDLRSAATSAFYYARTQSGRMTLHWILVTMITYFTFQLCSILVGYAHALPELIVPSERGWLGVAGLAAFYRGLCQGVACVLPLSLFATTSFLSYLILMQEDIVYTDTEIDGEDAVEEEPSKHPPDETRPSFHDTAGSPPPK